MCVGNFGAKGSCFDYGTLELPCMFSLHSCRVSVAGIGGIEMVDLICVVVYVCMCCV